MRSHRNIRHVFEILREGVTKHGFGQWAAILRDHDLKFQDGRAADSLKKLE